APLLRAVGGGGVARDETDGGMDQSFGCDVLGDLADLLPESTDRLDGARSPNRPERTDPAACADRPRPQGG
ncbi:MAG: hypothetical protein AAGK32_12350, partial [Actinomycetota bacterium]